jgi:hypothetical protein
MTPELDDFARALAATEEALDWELLGTFYCHEGGTSFFPDEQVAAIREAGLSIAGVLGDELARLPRGGGRSLYVGAAVAELVPILVERFVLLREVVVTNVPGREVQELNRGLTEASIKTGLELPRITTEPLDSITETFDHGWLVSVLNDPEAFPALHDALYGRSGELATGRGNLTEDKERAEALAEALLGRLAPEALLSTTDEELPVLRPLLARRGMHMVASEQGLLTGIVGDPLRFLRLRQA